MKFKKKAAKVSLLLGFQQSSPHKLSKPLKMKLLTRVGSYLEERTTKNRKQKRAIEIKQGEKRFDRIVGNKEVYFAHSLNYIYIDSSPVSVWFRLGRSDEDTVQVKLSVGGSNNSAGFLGQNVEISLYE